MGEKKKLGFSVKMFAFFGIMVIMYVFISMLSYQHLHKSLFAERASNTLMLMEKISQNVETGIQNRWNTIYALAYQFSDTEFSDMGEVQDEMKKMKSYRQEAITSLFAIDENGTCYTAGGRSFRWRDTDMLSSEADEVYLSGAENWSQGDDARRMFFMAKLPEPVVIDDITLTHLCLTSEMDFVDPYFNTEEFGQGSAAFILQKDGTELYRQKNSNPFSKVKDVPKALSQAEYHFSGSYEQLYQDIRSGECDCYSIRYEGKDYFVVFHSMDTNDWVSVMLVPEADVSGASKAFMQSIIFSTALIALGGVAVLLTVILTGGYHVNQKKEQVNEQLRKAVEAERKANEAKTRFLSSMSHDIRTPMNAIIGMTTLASKHLDDRDYVENCLAKVTLASNHLLTLINDVLDISKVEGGNMTLNPAAFSLTKLVNTMADIVRPQFTAKKQEFSLHIHSVKEEYLFADELRLNQIFINLLTNAVKYTPDGGKINVEVYQEAMEGTTERIRLIYVVEDNGIGMSKGFQEEMYTSFTRASDARINTIQGTGLGLAICRQMVELMQGSIDCVSALGEGTKFTVALELAVAEHIAEDELISPTKQHDYAGMHILVAEDNDLNWEIIEAILQMHGINATRAENGQRCLDMLLDTPGGTYDLILMDIQMPVMNGYEATEVIRSLRWNIPVIAMTADAFAEDIQRCMDAGMDGHIAKPVNLDNLLNILEKFGGGLNNLHKGLLARRRKTEKCTVQENCLTQDTSVVTGKILPMDEDGGRRLRAYEQKKSDI